MPKPPMDRGRTGASQDERSRGARGAAVESVTKRRRRTFTAADKLRIVRQADACLASGERGAVEALMREEGIYGSHLSNWRAQLRAEGAAGLDPRMPGRKPKLDAKDRAYAALEKRNAELERKLHIARVLIDLQKKAHELLGIAPPVSEEES